MTDDLVELKERVEQLATFVDLLESRIDLQAGDLRVISAICRLTPITDPDEMPDGEGGRIQIDNLLRSIATQQSMQKTDIRESARAQQRLQSCIDSLTRDLGSIEVRLRNVDSNVHTLVERSARIANTPAASLSNVSARNYRSDIGSANTE